MRRVAAYLVAAMRSLRTMQLPSGELPAVLWSESGEAYYAPAPLLCALAFDALAFVDPRSPRFVGRMRDLVPSSFFAGVVSLRWGLRLFIASEQSADGTWQRHGRLGAAGADVATTACAAAAMLPNAKWRGARADKRHLAALRSLEGRDWTTLEAAHALRYFALIGVDVQPLLARIRRDVAQAPPDIAAAHAIAGALRLMPGVHDSLPVPAAAENTLADALRLAALLDLSDAHPELDAALDRILRDATPPSRWPADPYAEHRIGSPAAALALRIANVARLAALPRGGSS